jgi:hypothetical protein
MDERFHNNCILRVEIVILYYKMDKNDFVNDHENKNYNSFFQKKLINY